MASNFIPTGNYSLYDLSELAVKERYGQEVAKPITVEKGIKYNSRLLNKNWISAYEEIRSALEAGTLTAYFIDHRGVEKYIAKSDWKIPNGDSYTRSWRTIVDGKLKHGDDAESWEQPVYVRTNEVDIFLGKIKGKGAKQADPKKRLEQSKNTGGRPYADPDGKIVAKIRELRSVDVTDKDIPWEIKFTRYVQKLKRDKINTKYLNVKIHPRVKGKEYTQKVGICLDTVKKLIEQSKN